jgi:Na+/proline symporter
MLTPATLAALYWRQVSEAGAFWSITLGATTLYASIVIAAIIASPLIQFAVVPATLVSLAALLAGSLISPEARAEKSQ